MSRSETCHPNIVKAVNPHLHQTPSTFRLDRSEKDAHLRGCKGEDHARLITPCVLCGYKEKHGPVHASLAQDKHKRTPCVLIIDGDKRLPLNGEQHAPVCACVPPSASKTDSLVSLFCRSAVHYIAYIPSTCVRPTRATHKLGNRRGKGKGKTATKKNVSATTPE